VERARASTPTRARLTPSLASPSCSSFVVPPLQISILRMLNHPHCIRIIDVHECVPFTGRWCESCACTSFKPSEADATHTRQARATAASPTRRERAITSKSVCAICSHSAGEHAGVTYHQLVHEERERLYAAHDSPMFTGADPLIAEEDEGETRNVMLIVQELAAGGELFSLLSHSGPFEESLCVEGRPRDRQGEIDARMQPPLLMRVATLLTLPCAIRLSPSLSLSPSLPPSHLSVLQCPPLLPAAHRRHGAPPLAQHRASRPQAGESGAV
jgi:hypothetical protein